MIKEELIIAFNELYEKVNARIRKYIVDNLSPEVPELIEEYNTARARLDKVLAIRADVNRYYIDEDNLTHNSVSTVFHLITWVFEFYNTVKSEEKEIKNMSPGWMLDNFVPLVIRMLDEYKEQQLARGRWTRFKLWWAGHGRKPTDDFIMATTLHAVITYYFRVSSLKYFCKTKRDQLLEELGAFGVIPAGCQTDPTKFIAYGNVITRLETFPVDLQKELKDDVDKLATLKKQMEE